jgi:OFA family oxalate/formate antiporter-like MFS transporter
MLEVIVLKNAERYRILVLAAVLQLFLGIIYVWSVFVSPVSEAYDWPVASAKLTSSFMLGFFVLGMLASGRLERKLGTTKPVLIGGILLAGGMAATAIIPSGSGWLIYLTYGIAGGFGVGMGYGAVVSCVPKWFPDKRGMATGVSVCAFGFSTVVFAPLVESLIGAFAVRTALLLLAAAFLAVTLALFSFIRLPDSAGAGKNAKGGAATADGARQYTTLEALKTGRFYLITFSLMLGTSVFFILNPSFKTLATERGLEEFGTVLVMMTGVASAVGRLVFPLVSEKIGREAAAGAAIGLTALCAFALSFAGGFLFMASVAVCAFCYGGYSGIYPLISGDHFGLRNVGSNYAAVMCGFAVSALFFPAILTGLFSGTSLFLALGVIGLAGVALIVILALGGKRARRAASR